MKERLKCAGVTLDDVSRTIYLIRTAISEFGMDPDANAFNKFQAEMMGIRLDYISTPGRTYHRHRLSSRDWAIWLDLYNWARPLDSSDPTVLWWDNGAGRTMKDYEHGGSDLGFQHDMVLIKMALLCE